MKNLIILVLLFLAFTAIVVAAYFFGRLQGAAQISLNAQFGSATPTPSVSPIPTSSPTITTTSLPPTASPSPAAPAKGKLTGKLCYPSSFIPNGKIIAKNTTTQAIVTQDYPGTQAGGGMTYTFEVPTGDYHVKFDATAPNGVYTGYYTSYAQCVDNPSGPDCSGQKTRPALTATVKAGETTANVNLCDFYYPQENPPAF